MSGKSKVFIIDDNQDLVEDLQDILEVQGYRVYPLTSGIGAVEKIRKVVPDVIILDLKIPGKSGFKIAQELKADDTLSKIPIIGISACYQDYAGLLQASGFKKFFTKPIDPEELIQGVEAVT